MLTMDFGLYDRLDQLVGLVEVKNLSGMTAGWAAAFRRNLLEQSSPRLRAVRFFMIATRDQLFIWAASHGPLPTDALPTHVLDAREFFRPYFERAQVNPDTVTSNAFELVVAAWLSDLSRSGQDENLRLLSGVGLSEAVRGGRIEYEAAA